MNGMQLEHVATPKQCRLSEAHRVASHCWRLASPCSSRPIACKARKVVAAASHQQPAEVDDSLQQLEALVGPVLREAGPQGLAVIVWALGQLRGPSTRRAVVQRVRRHCQQQPQLLTRELTGQGLFMLLHGLARFDAWHPENFKQQLLAAAAARLQLGLQQNTATTAASSSSSSSSNTQAFYVQQLPVVLLSLTQLQVVLPTPLLQQCEALLLPLLQQLSLQQVTVCLFAMGRARHNPSADFLDAAMARLDADVAQSGPRDVAQLLFGLAAMGGVREQLLVQQQQQQGRVARLLARLQEVMRDMDHSCLSMSMWAISRLSLRPSEPLLRAFLAATTSQLPAMSLISITTILSGFRTLGYLPPLGWMVETCNAARSIYNSDASSKPWQRRNSLRRLEETVTWFNTTVQLQVEVAGDGQSDGQNDGQSDGQQQQAGARGGSGRRAANVLGVNTAGSEAMIAAAVGVAAAVAQQWHP
ncbi:hypothetical protein OEZ86_001889 [Tetradesmus obliquus]|nr:hypothetical protein OEZ86_001889 [Tetradesmus obliquus]